MQAISEQEIQKLSFLLNSLGSDPDPELIPLGLCMGDCDSDNDCDTGLICFQRDVNETVPGCEGGSLEASRTDFCVMDGPEPSTISPTGSKPPTSPPTPKPSTAPPKSPTAEPSMAASEYTTTEATNFSEPLGEVEYVGNEGTFYARYPLGPCQGDCDEDADVSAALATRFLPFHVRFFLKFDDVTNNSLTMSLILLVVRRWSLLPPA